MRKSQSTSPNSSIPWVGYEPTHFQVPAPRLSPSSSAKSPGDASSVKVFLKQASALSSKECLSEARPLISMLMHNYCQLGEFVQLGQYLLFLFERGTVHFVAQLMFGPMTGGSRNLFFRSTSEYLSFGNVKSSRENLYSGNFVVMQHCSQYSPAVNI